MKTVVIVIIMFISLSGAAQSDLINNVFKSLEAFYLDSISNKGEKIYREFVYIGDEPFYSKPISFDVVLSFNDEYLNGYIEVFIEEHFNPDTILITLNGINYSSYWSLHKVLNHYYLKYEKKQCIKITDIHYKTVYFINSRLYQKDGFRIVAVYIPNDTNKAVQVIRKEFYYLD